MVSCVPTRIFLPLQALYLRMGTRRIPIPEHAVPSRLLNKLPAAKVAS